MPAPSWSSVLSDTRCVRRVHRQAAPSRHVAEHRTVAMDGASGGG